MKKLNPQMKDWMSTRGFEVAQIGVVFGSFNPTELIKRLAAAPSAGEKINATTVCRVLDEMRNAYH
jgi:hypothetical protein